MIRNLKGTSLLCSLTLAASTLLPAAALSAPVTLSSQDNSVNITGELLSFDNNYYLIETPIGEMSLSAEFVSCEGADCPSIDTTVPDVRLAGSETIGVGVMPLLLEGYAAHIDAESTVSAFDTGFDFNGSEYLASFVAEGGFGDELDTYKVHATDSVRGFRALLDGRADVSMSSRRISAKEAATLEAAGAGTMTVPGQEHILAFDSIIIITHPNNPVNSISMDQLAKVFTGEINNWSQLGGPNKRIRVVARQSDSGIRTVFADRIYGGPNLVLGNARIALNSTEMADIVAADEAAIGYTGFAFQRGTKSLDVVNECGFVTHADGFTIRTEEYALQRRLYMYTRADNQNKATEEFLDYAMSPDADELITKAGFVDFSIARRAQDRTSDRARQLLNAELPRAEQRFADVMLDEMQGYDQLSTTFRFLTGSSKLDERAIVDMERLASYLEEQPAGTKVKIVGFTDSVGSFANNRRLAAGRADQVRRSLLNFAGNRVGGLQITTAAYGEIAPAACNITETGRGINRRVEVWIEADSGTPTGT